MNSLKFINKLIKDTEQSIKFWKEKLEIYPNDEAFTRCLNTRIKDLQNLYLIKSELETLNILQDKLEFAVIKVNTEEGTKYHIVMKGYNSLISDEEYGIVSKVLEVKE